MFSVLNGMLSVLRNGRTTACSDGSRSRFLAFLWNPFNFRNILLRPPPSYSVIASAVHGRYKVCSTCILVRILRRSFPPSPWLHNRLLIGYVLVDQLISRQSIYNGTSVGQVTRPTCLEFVKSKHHFISSEVQPKYCMTPLKSLQLKALWLFPSVFSNGRVCH